MLIGLLLLSPGEEENITHHVLGIIGTLESRYKLQLLRIQDRKCLKSMQVEDTTCWIAWRDDLVRDNGLEQDKACVTHQLITLVLTFEM